MKFVIFTSMQSVNAIQSKTILISALDWGFGHTTRCVSLIQQLINQSNKIIFAGHQVQNDFIKNEFPTIKTELLEGYNVKLSSEKSSYLQMLTQFNKIRKAIKDEQNWVSTYVGNHNVDMIISDHRYGFRHSEIESIFMGHQLNVYVPKFRRLLNQKLSQYINKFNMCWVVDDKALNLAGDLSDPLYLTIPVHYIGLLNRFKQQNLKSVYDCLIIVSGAEPENALFLKQVENFFKDLDFNIAIVSTVKSKHEIANAKYYYYPVTSILQEVINQSKIIISKAGYTTLMEMVGLNKRCYLIPTKGQYEQVYLSENIKLKNISFIEDLGQIKKELE